MPSVYKYHELVSRLKRCGKRFVIYIEKGKGSHRMIYHPDIDGEETSYPIKCRGPGTEYDKKTIGRIIDRFKLPKGVL